MTPNELYALTPASVSVDNLGLIKGLYYDHMPEVAALGHEIAAVAEGPLKGRTELRFYRRHCYDGRHVWNLYSLWFDGRPVMILQNAGREGDDYHRRFITDAEALMRLAALIRSHLPNRAVESQDVVDPSADVPNLTTFYGDTLDGAPAERTEP